jgi:hypothetical protein
MGKNLDVPATAEGAITPHLFVMKKYSFTRQASDLNHYAKNIYSQNGEDGILNYIFDIIKPKTKYAVEFGAWDGQHLSNVFNLVKNFDWQALMIEANVKKYSSLQATAKELQGRICPVQGFVRLEGSETLDYYLEEYRAPKDPDILSIDVDGIDWFIWESLKNYRPRVVVIEFNPSIPSDILFVQAKNELINEGASAAALVHLGNEKGYSLVAVTNCNCIFLNNEEAPLLNIQNNSLDALWNSAQGRIFHGYNGKIYTAMMPRLIWHKIPIAPDALQILDKFEYGGALPR